jgi:ketosteroid isomerase-like protein
MYKFIVKRIVRRTFAHLSRGEYESVVRAFGPESRFFFAGEHALGGERRGREPVRRFFEDMLRLFPGIQIVPQDVLVNGWPWNTVVANHFTVSAPAAGGEYRNEGVQILRLRWGRVVEDLIFEDTQRIAAELRSREGSAAREPVAAGAP